MIKSHTQVKNISKTDRGLPHQKNSSEPIIKTKFLKLVSERENVRATHIGRKAKIKIMSVYIKSSSPFGKQNIHIYIITHE